MRIFSFIFGLLFAASPALALSIMIDQPYIYDGGSGTFGDIMDTHPYLDSVEYLYENNIIDGYDDGFFRAGNRANRAEFMKMVYGVKNPNPVGQNCFPDVQYEWFAKYVCAAAAEGIVEGYPDGKFHPERTITMAEASKIISETLNIPLGDGGDVWYEKYVAGLEAKNAIPLSVDQLDRPLRRDEIAEILARLMSNNTTKTTQSLENLTAQLPRIESCNALQERLDHPSNHRRYSRYGRAVPETMEMMAMDASMTTGADTMSRSLKTTAAPMAMSEAESSDDFSTTNIQVQGVDEADTIKTDGQYIYAVSNDKVQIIQALPASEMKIVHEIEEEGFYPQSIYVADGTLSVIGNSSNWYGGGIADGTPMLRDEARMIAPPRYSMQKARAYVYDITNPKTPVELTNVAFEGNTLTSRRIGDHLYIVVNRYASPVIMPYYKDGRRQYDDAGLDIPQFQVKNSEPEPVAGCADMRYFPGNHYQNYLVVAAINLKTPSLPVKRSVFLGNGETVYVSAENMYVTASAMNRDHYEDWGRGQREEIETLLFRFGLNDGDPEIEARGRVNGKLLNQFSLSESNGALRVATTDGNFWDSKNPSTNNVYSFTVDELSPLGKIENLAPGEKIYSTRFMGDRLYMVTFRNVDPLFVIDVADPSRMKVLGKLKIPGYSDYLHPYNETHLIGFGKDAVAAKSSDFAWYQGMKVAIFDVTDPENPTQMHSMVIGDRGTESPLLHDHHAILFDKSRNTLAFPIQINEVDDAVKGYDAGSEKAAQAFGDPVFQGAQVYDITLEDGFNLRGQVTHYTDEDLLKMGDYWPYNYEKNIQRVLRIDENLYTFSPSMIKASDIMSVEEQGLVKLQTTSDNDDEYFGE